jgi:type I restriction enzyme S subunit
MEEFDLPNGWKRIRLSDLVDNPKKDLVDGPFGSNLKSDEYIKSGIPVFKIQNIKENRFVDKHISYVSKEKAQNLVRHSFISGDLIITKLGEPLGLCCKVPPKYPFGLIVADLMRLRPSKSKVNTEYLIYVINSNVVKKQFKTITKGTTRARVNLTIVRDIEIPLPPLPEQQAIVSKIEELLSDLENGVQQLQTAQQQLKVYRQSLLKAAFEGKLTNKDVKDGKLPKGWRKVNITEIADKNKHAIKAGPFGSSLKKEFYVKNGYKIYGQEQVISNDAFLGDYYISEEKYQELRSCCIKPFDVLISLVGTVGKVLILPSNCKPGIINPRLIKISLNTDTYLPKFFKYYFESSSVKSLYSHKAQGTTMDVLNLGIIKTIPFPQPPIEEQTQIVSELESKLTVCDKIEETISQSLLQAESLRQSILKKAVEGRLVAATNGYREQTSDFSMAAEKVAGYIPKKVTK